MRERKRERRQVYSFGCDLKEFTPVASARSSGDSETFAESREFSAAASARLVSASDRAPGWELTTSLNGLLVGQFESFQLFPGLELTYQPKPETVSKKQLWNEKSYFVTDSSVSNK